MADPARKGNVALEEDDEFEDFQPEDWEPTLVRKEHSTVIAFYGVPR
jgi:hypothetical protein